MKERQRGDTVFLKFLKQMAAQCEIERETKSVRDGEKEMERNSEGAGGMTAALIVSMQLQSLYRTKNFQRIDKQR